MNYSKTVIIEANSINKLNKDSNSNDFEIAIPPLFIPKGSKVILDGSIVEEPSSVGEVIEFTDKNISDVEPYVSSKAKIRNKFYLNNIGQNMVVMPYIAQNVRHQNNFPLTYENLDIIVPEMNGQPANGGNKIFRISGDLTGNTNATVVANPWDYFMANGDIIDRSYILYNDNTEFMDINNQPLTTFTGLQTAPISPFPRKIASPASMKTALLKNNPNSNKFILLSNKYRGLNNANYPAEPFTKDIDIDLSNNLLETISEATFNITKSMTKSLITNENNIVNVESHEKLEKIDTLSGNTLINIPANFQHSKFTEGDLYNGIYSNILVENEGKWKGGHEFMNLTAGGDDSIRSTPLLGWEVGQNNLGQSLISNIFRNSNQNQTSFYPCILSIISNVFQHIYNFDDTPWRFPDDAPTNFLQWVDHNVAETGNPTSPVYNLPHPYIWNITYIGLANLFLARYVNENNKHYLYLDEAQINGTTNAIEPTTNPPTVWAILDITEIFGKKEINLRLVQQNRDSYIYAYNAPYTIRYGDNTFNGLPYKRLPTSTIFNNGEEAGGQFCDYTGPVINNLEFEIDEYTAIPEGFLIPTNIQAISDISNDQDLDLLPEEIKQLERIQTFFRLNEKYYGTETDPQKQQEDNKNWAVEVDLGFANDELNAWSRYLSRDNYKQVESELNFSFYPNYYPNIVSISQQVQDTENYLRPAHCYPISRNARMGTATQSKEHYLLLHSRHYEGIKDIIKTNNMNMDLTDDYFHNPDDRRYRLHPSIKYHSYSKWSEKYNIPFINILYEGTITNYYSVGFINFRNTMNGTGLGKVDYKTESQNFRTCFRLCTGVNFGFDPASSTNPWGVPLNQQQIVSNDTLSTFSTIYNFSSVAWTNTATTQPAILQQFLELEQEFTTGLDYNMRLTDGGQPLTIYMFSKSPFSGYWFNSFPNFNGLKEWNYDQNAGTISFLGASPYDIETSGVPDLLQARNNVEKLIPVVDKNNPPIVYSSYIEDYLDNITIGATNPSIKYENFRVQFQDFHTPRRWNIDDASGTEINIGSKVIVFNNNKSDFGAMNYIFTGNVNYPRGGDMQNPLPDPVIPDGLIINHGFEDSISGIGIDKLFVYDEYDNLLECKIENNQEINYKGSLFSLLGFDLKQLLPQHGTPLARYSEDTFNTKDGINYFTTNAILSQQQSQLISLYSKNRVDNPTQYNADAVVNTQFVGNQNFKNGYVVFERMAILAESEILRGNNLPDKLLNPFFTIESSLPTPLYMADNNQMKIMGYNYRQYKNQNYYFNYSSSYDTTIREDINLTRIRTQIRDARGRLATNLGDNVVVFYKIVIPERMSMLNQEDVKNMLKEYNQRTKKAIPQPFDVVNIIPNSDPLRMTKNVSTGKRPQTVFENADEEAYDEPIILGNIQADAINPIVPNFGNYIEELFTEIPPTSGGIPEPEPETESKENVVERETKEPEIMTAQPVIEEPLMAQPISGIDLDDPLWAQIQQTVIEPSIMTNIGRLAEEAQDLYDIDPARNPIPALPQLVRSAYTEYGEDIPENIETLLRTAESAPAPKTDDPEGTI
jgi:hypothetical protein